MAKIGAPVGGGKKAVNDPRDVVVVQKLLNAHARAVGFAALRPNGTVDQKTITAIGHFQKEVMGSKVTSLVEPKSKLFKTLSEPPKKIAARVDQKKEETKPKPKGKVYVVKWKGATYQFTESDMGEARQALKLRLGLLKTSYNQQVKNQRGFYTDLRKKVAGWNLSSMFIPNDVLKAPESFLKDAEAAVHEFSRCADAKSSAALLAGFKSIRVTSAKVNVSGASLNELSETITGHGKLWEDVATDVRDASFDGLTILLTARGMNPAAAGAATGAAKTSIQELCNKAMGPSGAWKSKGGWKGAADRIAFDAAIGGATGLLGMFLNATVLKAVGRYLTKLLSQRALMKTVLNRLVMSGAFDFVLKGELKHSIGRDITQILVDSVGRIVLKSGFWVFLREDVQKNKATYIKVLEKLVMTAKSEDDLANNVAQVMVKQKIIDGVLQRAIDANRKQVEKDVKAAVA
jgi:hypothetical protein